MKFLMSYPAIITGNHNVVMFMARALVDLGQTVYLCSVKEIRRVIRDFRPDVLMIFFGLGINIEDIFYAKRHKVKCIFWGGDEEDWFHYYIQISPLFDVWCCYSTATLYAHRLAGANAIYLPYAADTGVFFPVRLSGAEAAVYSTDIAFVGCYYPERKAILDDLGRRYTVRAYYSAREWDDKVQCEQLDFVTIRKIYAGAKIVLDPFSTCDRQRSDLLGSSRSYGLPCRSFEVPACRAFPLQPFREDLPLLYEVGREVDVFNSHEEMLEKIEFYLNKPSLRQDMAIRAYHRTLRDHTYVQRARTILQNIEKLKDLR